MTDAVDLVCFAFITKTKPWQNDKRNALWMGDFAEKQFHQYFNPWNLCAMVALAFYPSTALNHIFLQQTTVKTIFLSSHGYLTQSTNDRDWPKKNCHIFPFECLWFGFLNDVTHFLYAIVQNSMNNWITMKTVVLGIARTKKWLMLEICRYFYKIYIEWMVVILSHCVKCNSIHIFIQLAKNDSYSERFPLYRAWVELCWIWYTNNTVLNGWKHISFRCKNIFHAENDVI